MISVFGPGFIGGRFSALYPNETDEIDRDDYVPRSKDILYCISTTDNYNIFTNPTLDIETNLIVLLKVLQNCNQNNVFNFLSTWFVYGYSNGLITEDHYCDPKGMYPITKYAAEKILITYCETFGIKYRIFRLGNVIGEGDNATPKKNALQFLMKQLKENRDITLFDGGNFTRDYMYVDDVCSAIKLAMEQSKFNDIMHIATGVPTKFRDLIYYCKDKLNSTNKITESSYSPFQEKSRIKNCNLDISKLNRLGFKPEYTVYQALDKIMKGI